MKYGDNPSPNNVMKNLLVNGNIMFLRHIKMEREYEMLEFLEEYVSAHNINNCEGSNLSHIGLLGTLDPPYKVCHAHKLPRGLL